MGFATLSIHAGFAIYFPELFPNHLRSTGAGFCFNAGRLVASPVLIFSGMAEGAAGHGPAAGDHPDESAVRHRDRGGAVPAGDEGPTSAGVSLSDADNTVETWRFPATDRWQDWAGTPVKVRVLGDMASIGRDMADAMRREILDARAAGRGATLIVPVGPVDQFPLLAQMINDERIDCRDVVLINMDEYLTDDDRLRSADHPLSFRGFMDRLFYDRLDPALAPPPENRVFPDPRASGADRRA